MDFPDELSSVGQRGLAVPSPPSGHDDDDEDDDDNDDDEGGRVEEEHKQTNLTTPTEGWGKMLSRPLKGLYRPFTLNL